MRNLGRGGLSEAENSTKWKCYCCAPEKIKKHTEFAEVLKLFKFWDFLKVIFQRLRKANQQRSEWQQKGAQSSTVIIEISESSNQITEIKSTESSDEMEVRNKRKLNPPKKILK